VAKVGASISISLDGFVTGPNPGLGNGLGDGGEVLHEWVVALANWRESHGHTGGEVGGADSEVLDEMMAGGAAVMGRRMFDDGEGPWGEDPSIGRWGEKPPFGIPIFVLTHHAREPLELEGGTTFTFVTDGIESAVAQAQEAAGGKDVGIAGGAQAIQQALKARLLDELQLSVVPVLLGDGVRLFENLGDDPPQLERVRVIDSPRVTHLKYRIAPKRP
jgi:dihydrofolate reductase